MLSSNVYLNTAGCQVVNGKSYKQITTIQEMPVLSDMEFYIHFLKSLPTTQLDLADIAF